MVKLLQVVFEVSVSFPNEEVSCYDGNGIRNRTATAPPKIIRDITRGISRFTIRALFCAEVRLWLLFILAVASDSISSWRLSLSEVLPSFDSKASRNWELLASMWFRNGSDEVLLIQLARIKSEEKKRYINSVLFLCEVRVSLRAEDTLPKQWTTFKTTKWYRIHILYPLKGMGIPH